MQIRFPKENLQKAMVILQKAAQNKTSSNLPGSIYISTKNNTVELQANDFELGIKVTVDAQIIEQGTIVIGSKYFQELVRKMPGAVIELNRPEGTNKLIIKSGSSEFNLVTLQQDSFTLVEQIHDEYNILIDAQDMKDLIDYTNYAAATDEDRPIFSGALLEIKDTVATMVATDTHRMAIKKVNLEEPAKTEMRAVIPIRLLSEISRLLPIDNPALVKIIWNRTQIAFLFDSVYMISKLIEGTYPEYERVIPTQFDATAEIDRRDLTGAVDRVSLLARDISYNFIRYDWKEKEVILSSQNAEVGMVKEEVPCDLKGKEFVISFNGRYVSDILKHSTGDVIYLSLKDNGPVVIRQDNNPNYTYIITPVRTN